MSRQRIRPQALDQEHGRFSGPGFVTGTIVVYDEGSPVGVFDQLNFAGVGVGATDAGGGRATITIPGGAAAVPVTGSIVGSNEGAVQGGMIQLDVRGEGLNLALSGTYGTLTSWPEHRTLNMVVGDGTNVISTGTKGLVRAGFKGRVEGWELASARAVTGTISFNLLRAYYPGLHTGLASIVATAPPYLSGSVKNIATGSALSSWDTDFEEGAWFEVLVNGGVANVTLVTLAMPCLVLGVSD